MSAISVFDGARPRHQGDLTLETAGIVPIPVDARYGANHRNFTVWFAPNMELSGVFTGTLAATLGLGLWTGLGAIVLGVLLGALPVAALSLWGPKTGMAQLPLARLPFGKTIAIPALVQWLSAVAWDGLVGLFGGEAAQILFHVPFAVGRGHRAGPRGADRVPGLRVHPPAGDLGRGDPRRHLRAPDLQGHPARRLPDPQHRPRGHRGRDLRAHDHHRLQRWIQLGHLRRRLQPLHGRGTPRPDRSSGSRSPGWPARSCGCTPSGCSAPDR